MILRIVMLSDTHGNFPEVPDGDVLIHAGDFCKTGNILEFPKFNAWMGTHSHKHKLLCAGNHDRALEWEPNLAKMFLGEVTYLQEESVTIEGVKFYFSPFQPEFMGWSFNIPRGSPELKAKWAAIPDDTEILVTHCPPYGILDMNKKGEYCGCELLRERIKELEYLKIACGGHIHEAHGTLEKDGVMFVNASVLDHKYRLRNKPTVIDFDTKTGERKIIPQ